MVHFFASLNTLLNGSLAKVNVEIGDAMTFLMFYSYFYRQTIEELKA